MYLLQAENVTKVYGGRFEVNSNNALNGISLDIEEGEFTAIMGPSGSGKTTLLNILSGIDEATRGKIKIMEKDITKFTRDEMAIFRRENLGIISQDFNLLDDLTLEENAILPLFIKDDKSQNIEDRVRELFKFFNIWDERNKYPYNVSGGQQQRTAACRALITNPKIVMADEPTGNLDSKAATKFMKYMQMINENKNTTIVMVTHDSYAASFCKKVIFIKDGRIYTEIYRKESKRDFFNRILDCLAVIGGEINEV
ncbi:ABC transporter ATP-binding protein [Clostridium felsineum]|uniref:ABC transporter ATP-binding protein YxdL n=1 Tax=Clostridium felsineum TaxID=36839 RepID=A0A1S8L4X1_9CLOT|nr:ABC transporter ATP-binding protein [Clostridium felsineum]URZ02333.1 ABC transporter ATP-binding protein YxdL [Clostridium felsineum]URZ04912.1 ABC transporter ATP-binding protein YxdL [Clostridium felsineum]URZ09953.1 ABC transporter ATP-binding protein YxdL [Clostridium felsineum]URZ18125.1 ABC transporter ATP-binding protein YxdL [Clostridium felsineum DSM 794]